MSNWDTQALQTNWNLTQKRSNKKIVLTEKDIKSAFGGEGLIYLKDGFIHKVYPDTKKLPPEQKLFDLQQLKHPSIIVPQDLLLDSYGKLRGFTMPYKDAFELCMVCPRAFKDRWKITPATITGLVKIMQGGTNYLHSNGWLQVDGNEMNYLVDKKFDNVYFIDTNSYQSARFPATAIMDSIKDPHTKVFNKGSDWYSWACVTFNMFIGIHPFKGIYKQNLTMTQRMERNISVFNPEVTIPAVCAPFDTIPTALREWYEAVFEKGLRTPPPDSYENRIIVSTNVTKQVGSDNFLITLMYTYQKPVIAYMNGYTMTSNGLYKNDKVMVGLHDVANIVVTPQGQALLARLEAGRVKLFNIVSKVEMPCNFNADDIMSYQGRLYLKNKGDVNEVDFVALGAKVMPTLKKVGGVVENDTHMFEGCAVSNLSNACHLSIFPKAGSCYQVQVPELAKHRVLDAKFDNGVMIAIAARVTGEHDKFILRFEPGFVGYDLRVQKAVQVSEINFVVLDKGVVLHMTDVGTLECFKSNPGAKDIMEIDDQAIDTDCILLKNGDQAMFARGEKLYKFSMQQKQVAPNIPSNPGKGRKIVRDKNTGKIIDVSQVAKKLVDKDKTYQKIYKDDDVLINAIIGIPPKTSGMI